MTICIYGTKDDLEQLNAAISQLKSYTYRQIKMDLYEGYDHFIHALTEKAYDVIIVTVDNAEGMEGVIAAKAVATHTPVIWFSNDRDFGVQSYRCHVAYFHPKPITVENTEKALSLCFL